MVLSVSVRLYNKKKVMSSPSGLTRIILLLNVRSSLPVLILFLLPIFDLTAAAIRAWNDPSPCTWLEKQPLDDGVSCVDKCFQDCATYPGEYLCSGFVVFTDDEIRRLNMSDPMMYSYVRPG